MDTSKEALRLVSLSPLKLLTHENSSRFKGVSSPDSMHLKNEMKNKFQKS